MTKQIGTKPEQTPSNADLGTLAYQNKESAKLDQLLVGEYRVTGQTQMDKSTVQITTTDRDASGDGAQALRLEHFGDQAVSGTYGPGITFAQKWYTASESLIRTGSIHGIKTAGNGVYGGGLSVLRQPANDDPMKEALRVSHNGWVTVFDSGGSNGFAFFDAENKRLSVGTNSAPTNTLDVYGGVSINGVSRILSDGQGAFANGTNISGLDFYALNYPSLNNAVTAEGLPAVLMRTNAFSNGNSAMVYVFTRGETNSGTRMCGWNINGIGGTSIYINKSIDVGSSTMNFDIVADPSSPTRAQLRITNRGNGTYSPSIMVWMFGKTWTDVYY